MNNPWDYRKNLGAVGGYCPHDKWWSEDCQKCIDLVDQTEKHLKGRYGKDDE